MMLKRFASSLAAPATASWLAVVAVVVLAQVAQAKVVWHDPYLNWDFWNTTGMMANNLEIVVDNPNFAPNLNDPAKVWSVPFPNVGLSNADHDGNGDQDTVVTYWGANVSPDVDGIPYGSEIPADSAHGGLYMLGSGLVLDAYWTGPLPGGGNGKIGPSYPVTYERTRVVGDPAIYMELNIAPGFFDDPLNAGAEAGWTEIRTFVNIPADRLNLPDIGKDLDLSTLAEYEVTPRVGGPEGPAISPSDVFLMTDSSIFDVYLADIAPEFSNSRYESLLVATVVTANSPPLPAGAFWNLNPQCPEPATVALLLLGAVGVLAMSRRARK